MHAGTGHSSCIWTLAVCLGITPAAMACSPCRACSLLLHFVLIASLLKLSLYLSISVGDRKDLSSCKRRRRHCWRVFIVSILLCEAKTISLVIASVNFLLERWEATEGGNNPLQGLEKLTNCNVEFSCICFYISLFHKPLHHSESTISYSPRAPLNSPLKAPKEFCLFSRREEAFRRHKSTSEGWSPARRTSGDGWMGFHICLTCGNLAIVTGNLSTCASPS